MKSLFVHHVFKAQTVLSTSTSCLLTGAACLLFHERVILCRSGWPPTDLSEKTVHFAKEV